MVAIFCGAMTGGDRPTVFGDGEQTRDYVYVGDVAAAFAPPPTAAGPGPYNVGTGIETSVLELGGAIAAAAGASSTPSSPTARPGEVQRIVDRSRRSRRRARLAPRDLARRGHRAHLAAVAAAE